MLLAFPVLVAGLWLSCWAFYRFSPEGARVANFNRAVVTGCVLLVLYEFLHMHRELQGTSDESWWPVVASIRAAFFTVVLFVIAGLARLVLFRK